jgi:hypothetical protein
MPQTTTICRQVVKITEDYLGPSAPRFIERLSISHLDKDSSQLNQADIEELTKWARLAAAVLTDDSKLITEFTSRLNDLSKKRIA